ncbi:type II toxin-antitoxin system RelE/ParE family toxin [Orbus wheelerorum]|uniref:type II toxin-antitoxin system RelE/ParE family toxin n=1 Tax=Orbus wheelerorum TaxID=3074111 RepID=UPI00370DBAEC
MTHIKPILLRSLANQDIENAIDHYLTISIELADDFVTDLEYLFTHIGQFPTSGSTRYAYELNIPDLRSRILKRYPYIIFYVEYPDNIDVWRILHEKTNMPSWMETK